MPDATDDDRGRHRGAHSLDRRGFLRAAAGAGAGVAALVAAGFGGYKWPWFAGPDERTSTSGTAGTDGVAKFVSEPDLSPPQVSVTRVDAYFTGSAANRRIFLAPKGYSQRGPGQNGLMILDSTGRLVYFLPTSKTAMDLRPQTYQGKPVITWWEGDLPGGYGSGVYKIADTSYEVIATVKAGDGLQADLHDCVLTARGTALITCYRTAGADLSGVGGSSKGTVLSGVVQEIDVASGKVLFSWDSLDHVDVSESRQEPEKTGTKDDPFDYFHLNSIAEYGDDLLISARNTWTVYRIAKSDGRIRWRLGGKKSDFTQDAQTRFYWQHDARVHGEAHISLFDNGAAPAEETQSRALRLSLDLDAKTVTLEHAYTHPSKLLAGNQGNLQLLDDGRAFVGWGNQPYFSEFAKDGRLVLDGRLPSDDQSYRALTGTWNAVPSQRPALVAHRNDTGGNTLYASWNGSTRLDRWRTLAGSTADKLAQVAVTKRTGFETIITARSDGPYFAVEALDAAGRTLATSGTVTSTGT